MPPSLRKRKQAVKPVEPKPKRMKTLTVEHKTNTTGLAALPDELHLEIFSHLPSVPICYEEENLPLDRPGTDRHFTLNALSQTCTALRAVYLPYLWERIEVYDGFKLPRKGTRLPRIPTAKKKKNYTSSMAQVPSTRASRQYAEELLRQLEIVTIRQPSLAQYVRSMNVIVTPFSIPRVYEELIRCIALLPNLKVVRLSIINLVIYEEDIVPLYARHTFPQIDTLFLNEEAISLVDRCPNVSSLSTDSSSGASDDMYIYCPWLQGLSRCHKSRNVKTLGLFPCNAAGLMTISDSAYLRDFFANLTDITLECSSMRAIIFEENHPIGVAPVLSFENLGAIRIRADIMLSPNDGFEEEPAGEEQDKWLKWAERSLHKMDIVQSTLYNMTMFDTDVEDVFIYDNDIA